MSEPENPAHWQADEDRWSAAMARAHAGDQAAYARLLTEIGSVIENYIRARFGPLNGLEDYVQECLLTVHKARHTYDSEQPFRPWLFTLVRHRIIDLLRSGRRVQRDRKAAETSDAGSDPSALHRQLDGVKILEGTAREYREAITLTHYAGCTAAEAAAELGISESALKARLRRGLAAIRKTLEAEDSPL